MTTQERIKGNRYNIVNLIAELTKALQDGDTLIDIVTEDDGWVDADSGEWVEHIGWSMVTSK